MTLLSNLPDFLHGVVLICCIESCLLTVPGKDGCSAVTVCSPPPQLHGF